MSTEQSGALPSPDAKFPAGRFAESSPLERPMFEQLIQQLPSLGVSGLLFIMWWIERQERTNCQAGLQEALKHTATIAQLNSQLLDVVRSNTEALTALRTRISDRLAALA